MKNMKLTNLSLSVLIALGLVACGGSDDKGNAATDTDTSGSTGGTSSTGPKGPKVDPKDGLEVAPRDPKRAIPGLTVEPNHEAVVKVRKQLYIDRQSRDSIAGYNGQVVDPKKAEEYKQNVVDNTTLPLSKKGWDDNVVKKAGKPSSGADLDISMSPEGVQGGISYNTGATDKEDILRASSIYNYFEHQSKEGSLNADGGIHANPSYSYALGDDGNYYRVKPAGSAKWDALDANSKFELIDANTYGKPTDYGNKHGKGTSIPMKELVFIPNALSATPNNADTTNNKAYLSATTEFKEPAKFPLNKDTAGLNVINPKSIAYFDVTRGEVSFDTFEIVGASRKYNLVQDFNTKNLPLDLSNVKPAYEIQKFPIQLDYTIKNPQATGTLNDDEWVKRTAKVGEVKLYDLPYSRSLITVNQQAVADGSHPNAAPNNLFGLGTGRSGNYGPFQVVGFQTPALPRDGRADYVGKSYGVNSEGDVLLTADFAINRAGISGIVNNRVSSKGTKLADLKLQQIQLSNALWENTASNGMQSTSWAPNGDVVEGGGAVTGTWAVALFGPNAEEAAGVIDLNHNGGIATPDNVAEGKKFEVFSTQRKTLIDDSLNPGVGSAKP